MIVFNCIRTYTQDYALVHIYIYIYIYIVGSLPQLIGFIRFGEPVPHGLSARPRVWAGFCVVVVHIWLLQKLINHMWEGTLTDVGLGVKAYDYKV